MQAAIIEAIGLDPAASTFAAALAHLGREPGLLILDNLETPWDVEREDVEAVLGALHRVSGVALLASIRGNEPPGGLRWTRQRTMHPLEVPHDRELFLDIAQDIKPDDPHLLPLLTELGGVPLAIELVAHQAASHDTLTAIHEQWQRVGVGLARRRGIEPSRLTALDRSLELSVNSPRLGDAGRRLFAILGQSPAGLCAEDLDGLLGADAFDARQGVLDCGLGFERDGRLDLLPPVRDYTSRYHPPSDGDAKSWRAHFLRLAEKHGKDFGSSVGAGAVRRIMYELPNVDFAMRAALAAGEIEDCLRARGGITSTIAWTGRGSPRSLRDLAKACETAGNIRGEADCVQGLGDIAFERSDHNTARKAYEQALPLYRQIGQIVGAANCIESLGDIALQRSDHTGARKAFEAALPLFRQVGQILGQANCIKSLGDIELARSDHDSARKAYEQALPLYRQVGQILGEAGCIRSLGDIAFARSDCDAAREAYAQALPLYRQVGNILGEANCIASLGDVGLARSDYDRARKDYEQALPLFRQVGDILGQANCIQALGDIARERCEYDVAREAYTMALSLYSQIGNILGEANCIVYLGDIALVRSDHEAARKAYERALPLFRQVGNIRGEAGYIIRLGNMALAHSDHKAARKAYERALPLFRQIGDILGEANCIQRLGDIAVARSDYHAARSAFCSALKLYERIAEPFSIGQTHRRLALLSEGKTREDHLAAATAAWASVGRDDLVKQLPQK